MYGECDCISAAGSIVSGILQNPRRGEVALILTLIMREWPSWFEFCSFLWAQTDLILCDGIFWPLFSLSWFHLIGVRCTICGKRESALFFMAAVLRYHCSLCFVSGCLALTLPPSLCWITQQWWLIGWWPYVISSCKLLNALMLQTDT